MGCIIRSIDLDTRTPVECGVLKFQKVKRNTPTCMLSLTVSGSPVYCIRRWIDMHLRELLDQTPSYVNNSNDISLALRCLISLEDDMLLLTANDTAIHSNVNT